MCQTGSNVSHICDVLPEWLGLDAVTFAVGVEEYTADVTFAMALLGSVAQVRVGTRVEPEDVSTKAASEQLTADVRADAGLHPGRRIVPNETAGDVAGDSAGDGEVGAVAGDTSVAVGMRRAAGSVLLEARLARHGSTHPESVSP